MTLRSGTSNAAWKRSAKKLVVFDGRYIHDRYHGIGRYAFHLVEELGRPCQQ
ncbi:MAG: hypothetical protein ABIO92_06635 [Chloroflexia bacterium]